MIHSRFTFRLFLLLTTLALSTLASVELALANEEICRKTGDPNKGTVVRRVLPNRCQRGYTLVTKLYDIYGSGSAGDLTTVAAANLILTQDANTEYRNILIPAQTTLVVYPGTVIRATGTVTINGTISVLAGAAGATRTISSSGTFQGGSPAHPGMSERSAPDGYFGIAESVSGGSAGRASVSGSNLAFVRPGIHGGGGGGAGYRLGMAGGGTVTIIARGRITNNGVIEANGEDADLDLIPHAGAGGGGGGTIIIASATEILNTATIRARGGAGGPALMRAGTGFDIAVAPGGGGSGGNIHLISPLVENRSAFISVAGGDAGPLGADTNASAFNYYYGGGAGGHSFGGSGGGGGITGVPGNFTIQPAVAGLEGNLLRSFVVPETIFAGF